MTPPARTQAAIELLDAIIPEARHGGRPADIVLGEGLRARRYAGSKDRRAIRQLVYRAIRAYGSPPTSGRAALLGLAGDDPGLAASFDGSRYGPSAADSAEPRAAPGPLPAWLTAQLPPDELPALLERAPLDLRVNTLKADRESVLAEFPHAVPIGAVGLRLAESVPIEATAAYRDGRVEVQDYGSQRVVEACQAKPGMTVLDLCAGGGGKTLALAAALGNEGRLIATDTNRERLRKLEPRAARAGARVELRLIDGGREAEQLTDLSGQVDVVLVDAPCSGLGTLRRHPDAKWRVGPQDLQRFAVLQNHVLELARPLVRPGGALVYAVCSPLPVEGQERTAALLALHPEWTPERLPFGRQQGEGVILTPAHDATDGFYVARLTRRC